MGWIHLAARRRPARGPLSAAAGRVQRFLLGGTELDGLSARNLRFYSDDGTFNMSAPGGSVAAIKTKDIGLNGLTAASVQLRRRGERTEVALAGVRSQGGNIKDSRFRNVSADSLKITDLPTTTNFALSNMRAAEWNFNGTLVHGIESPAVDIENTPGPVLIYADKMRIASVDSDSAVIGSLNIGGVRITALKGHVEVRSNDIDAGTVQLKKTSTISTGGTLEAVRIERPVYVLEPSGRYRASADMSLGGGALGSIALGAARASVEVNNESGVPVDEAEIVALARHVLDAMRVHPQAELSVVLVDEPSMEQLHVQWMD